MNTPTSEAADEKTLPVELAVEAEISKLAKKESSKLSTPIETNSERIRSSVARLTSNSIDELQGLISELQNMQQFLKSEVDSVQHQIESALAGINIIVETIAPWQSTELSKVPPTSARAVRAGPAANIEAARRGTGASWNEWLLQPFIRWLGGIVADIVNAVIGAVILLLVIGFVKKVA